MTLSAVKVLKAKRKTQAANEMQKPWNIRKKLNK